MQHQIGDDVGIRDPVAAGIEPARIETDDAAPGKSLSGKPERRVEPLDMAYCQGHAGFLCARHQGGTIGVACGQRLLDQTGQTHAQQLLADTRMRRSGSRHDHRIAAAFDRVNIRKDLALQAIGQRLCASDIGIHYPGKDRPWKTCQGAGMVRSHDPDTDDPNPQSGHATAARTRSTI